MKKTISMLLALVLAGSLAACGAKENGSSGAANSSNAANSSAASSAASSDSNEKKEDSSKAKIIKVTIEGAAPKASESASSSSSSETVPAASESATATSSAAAPSTDNKVAELPEIKPLPGDELSAEQLKAEMDALYAGTGKYADLPVAVMETSEGTIRIRLFPQQAPKAVENFIVHAQEGYYDGLTFHRVINEFMIQGGDPEGTGMGGSSIWNTPFEDEFTDLLHNFRGALSMANAGFGTNGSQFFIVQNPAPISTDEEMEKYLEVMYMNKIFYQLSMQLNNAITSGAVTSQEQFAEVSEKANAKLTELQEKGVTEEYRAKMAPVMERYRTQGGTPHLDYKHTVFGFVVEGMDVVDKIAQNYATE